VRGNWLLDDRPPTKPLDLSIEHILVWHDEPQVVTATDADGARYLGVATDDADDYRFVRWVYARITKLEFRALLCGATTLRDALAKEQILIVDHSVGSSDVETMRWASTVDVPDELRPTTDSYLPDAARSLLEDSGPVREEQIVIDGDSVAKGAISFSDLGSITSLFQQLWTALVNAVWFEGNQATPLSMSALNAVGMAGGSFVLKMQPAQQRVFGLAFAEYRKLVESGADVNELTSLLSRLGGNVSSTFSEYMLAIGSRNLEVLALSTTSTAYISPRKATHVAAYLAPPPLKMRQRKIESKPTIGIPFTVNGYFDGYGFTKKTFDFISSDKGDIYSGDVEPSLLISKPVEDGLILGSHVKYTAQIRPVQKGDKLTHTLLYFSELTTPKPA
jgi:hypothetical protein